MWYPHHCFGTLIIALQARIICLPFTNEAPDVLKSRMVSAHRSETCTSDVSCPCTCTCDCTCSCTCLPCLLRLHVKKQLTLQLKLANTQIQCSVQIPMLNKSKSRSTWNPINAIIKLNMHCPQASGEKNPMLQCNVRLTLLKYIQLTLQLKDDHQTQYAFSKYLC